jgi:hypothetical protein
MGVFPSQRERHRRERRFLRAFFVLMGVLAATFALLLLVRLVVG